MNIQDLTPQKLNELYTFEQFSDRKIAEMYNLHRTTVVMYRKRYNIPTRKTTHDIAMEKVVEKLQMLGYEVENMKEKNKTSSFDLLVNGSVRVSVLSNQRKGKMNFAFLLTTSSNTKGIESHYKAKLKNGRLRKKYHEISDIFILVGMNEQETYYWILPVSAVPTDRQNISTSFQERNAYKNYVNQWQWIDHLYRKNMA